MIKIPIYHDGKLMFELSFDLNKTFLKLLLRGFL